MLPPPRPILRRSAIAIIALGIVGFPSPAFCHPLGLSSVNRSVGIRLTPPFLDLDYLLDFAELPAWSEIDILDADHNGTVTPDERERYVLALLPRLSLALSVNTQPLALRQIFNTLEAPQGQAGMSTLRVAITFRTALPATAVGRQLRVTLTDTSWSDHNGWREIDVGATQGYILLSSTLPPGAPRAGAILGDPALPVTPPREDTVTLVYRRSANASSPANAPCDTPARGLPSRETAQFARLLRTGATHHGVGFVRFALALAFALGAGHALGPGGVIPIAIMRPSARPRGRQRAASPSRGPIGG